MGKKFLDTPNRWNEDYEEDSEWFSPPGEFLDHLFVWGCGDLRTVDGGTGLFSVA